MRQLLIQVLRRNETAIINIVKSYNGTNITQFDVNTDESILKQDFNVTLLVDVSVVETTVTSQ
ncbi:hypothetical protein [Nostoc sp. MG11]|uniref:hypothetical protein n=1 Tax=Nostoc sp. MG11 TaxID=2721166 RepID=UPI001865AF93|nr:hypothetical protein [Nostoc sp. MG11]